MFVSARTSSTLFLDNLPPSISDFPSTRSSSTLLSSHSDLRKRNCKKQSTLQQTCLMKPVPRSFELLFWQNNFVGCLMSFEKYLQICPFYCKNAGSLPQKWILLRLVFKNFNDWLQNSYFENTFSLGLITLIIDNINNIKNLRSTTHRFSGPGIPMVKMLKKLLLKIFLVKFQVI